MKYISKEQVMDDYTHMKRMARKYMKRGNYEKALRSIFVACGFMYTFSQIYYDDELETIVKQIGFHVVKKNVKSDIIDNSVIFYDGFGNDRRGLAVIYLKALKSIGYKITYITYEQFESSIGQIKEILKSEEIVYIKSVNLLSQMRELNLCLEKVMASKALLYMYPDDVVAAGVFSQYTESMQRFLINLTDHAFWLGKEAVDCIIEFRSYGANISFQQRKIDKHKIVYLPFYPNIPKSNYKGMPFDDENKKIIFSGGALYKTYGMNNLYYNMVENMLKMDSKVIFYYAGEGNTTELNRLIAKYPQRVFYSKEREDFFEIIKRCYFYFSTYPYFGGLITQYAIAAGKLPITLASDDILGEQTVEVAEGIWYFHDVNVLYREIKMLLQNEKYLHKQEEKIKNILIGKIQFQTELRNILEKQKNERQIVWKRVDVKGMQEISLKRVGKAEYSGLFCRVKAPFLVKEFPVKFVKGFIFNILKQKRIARKGKI